MKRLDPVVKYGNVGDAYVVMEEVEDGDLVWWDEAANEIERLTLSDSDRTALATAVRELKERRGTYETQLRRFQASGSDPAVIETWERAVAQVEEAIQAVERMAKL